MKIECPSCAAKYSIGDDKVQDRLAKIRCRKCGTTIVIDGKHNPPNIYAADAGGAADSALVSAPPSVAASSAGAEYTVDFGDGDQRTMSLAQVVDAYNRGEISAEHYVWADGFDDWQPLGEVDGIVQALHVAAHAAPAPAPAAVPRAAAIGGRGGADLFGRIEQAGSEEDVTTSAAAGDPMHAAPAATGARNESSVLFSLSALTSAAANTKPSGIGGGLSGLATSPSGPKEDSGLIDLRALTAAAAASDERKEAVAPIGLGMTPAPLGGVTAAPLGMAPPFGVPTTAAAMSFDPTPMHQPKNRMGLFIAAGIVVAAVAVALIVVSSKEEPAPIPSAMPVAAPAPTPTPAPAPTPTAESTAQPPATGAPEEDAGAPEEKKAAAPKAAWRPRKQTSTSSAPQSGGDSGSAAATKKAPPKKSSTSGCGCAPGDLQCAMRCAAGG